MDQNPYQPPSLTADGKALCAARRRVFSPAVAVWICGLLYIVAGAGMLVLTLLIIARGIYWYTTEAPRPFGSFVPPQTSRMVAISIVVPSLGWCAMRYARKLYRLESKRDGQIACVLGMLLYPMSFLTVPLGIYGLIALRRKDVQTVLDQRAAMND